MFKFLVALYKVYRLFLGTITNAESFFRGNTAKKAGAQPFWPYARLYFFCFGKDFSAQSMVMDQAKVFSAPGASVS